MDQKTGQNQLRDAFDWSSVFCAVFFGRVMKIETFCEYYSLYEVENFFGVQAHIVTSQQTHKYLFGTVVIYFIVVRYLA